MNLISCQDIRDPENLSKKEERTVSGGSTHWSPAVSECVPCSAPCSPTGWCCTLTSPQQICGTVWSAGETARNMFNKKFLCQHYLLNRNKCKCYMNRKWADILTVKQTTAWLCCSPSDCTCVLRILKSADDLFCPSSCSIVCWIPGWIYKKTYS